ncbi:MAG: hypothetical protein GTO02_17775, partial [Candidatus Dadabacteria bacterium]|nr:hypothetical protein [Candidatus Dadabacteria bacterium]
MDFTRSEFCYDIVLNSKSNEVVVEINSENAMEMFALLKAALFEDKKISIIGWNLKNLFTCALAQTNNELEYEC